MEVAKETVESHASCPNCEKAVAEATQSEETGLALLLGLLPVITLTFFGQVGLL